MLESTTNELRKDASRFSRSSARDFVERDWREASALAVASVRLLRQMLDQVLPGSKTPGAPRTFDEVCRFSEVTCLLVSFLGSQLARVNGEGPQVDFLLEELAPLPRMLHCGLRPSSPDRYALEIGEMCLFSTAAVLYGLTARDVEKMGVRARSSLGIYLSPENIAKLP